MTLSQSLYYLVFFIHQGMDLCAVQRAELRWLLRKKGQGAFGKYVGQEGRHADLRTEVLSARAVGPGSKARGPCCSHGGGSLVTMVRSLISLVTQ